MSINRNIPITQHSKLRLKEEQGELGSAYPLSAMQNLKKILFMDSS